MSRSPQLPFVIPLSRRATLLRLVATRAVEPVPPPPTLESTSAATFKHHAAEEYAEPPPRWRPLTARTVALLSAARPIDVDRLGVTIDHRAYAGGDAALDAPVTIYSMRLPEGAFHGVTAVRGLHPFGGWAVGRGLLSACCTPLVGGRDGLLACPEHCRAPPPPPSGKSTTFTNPISEGHKSHAEANDHPDMGRVTPLGSTLRAVAGGGSEWLPYSDAVSTRLS